MPDLVSQRGRRTHSGGNRGEAIWAASRPSETALDASMDNFVKDVVASGGQDGARLGIDNTALGTPMKNTAKSPISKRDGSLLPKQDCGFYLSQNLEIIGYFNIEITFNLLHILVEISLPKRNHNTNLDNYKKNGPCKKNNGYTRLFDFILYILIAYE